MQQSISGVTSVAAWGARMRLLASRAHYSVWDRVGQGAFRAGCPVRWAGQPGQTDQKGQTDQTGQLDQRQQAVHADAAEGRWARGI